jgi:monoamine oxidase
MERVVSRRALIKGAAVGTAAAAVPAAAARAGRGEERVQVAVVGAGAAGLYAADVLARAGRSVVILEASPRIGGRVLNFRLGPRPADIAEAGGEFVSPDQRIVQRLIKRFRLKMYEPYTKGKTTLFLNGKVSRFEGTIPPLPGEGTKELIEGFALLTAMAADVPLDAPWKAPEAAAWDSQTAGTWIEDNITDPGAKQLIAAALGGPVSVQAKDISLLHYLFIAAGAGGPLELVTVGSGVLSDRVVGGTALLVEGLAGPLRNVTKLSTPVIKIQHGGGPVRLTTPNGRWIADQVILAMAPTMTQQILFEPVLPVDRTQSVQRTGMGSSIKAFPIYRTPFWRKRGLNGIVQNGPPPFALAVDNTPPDNSFGVLLGFIQDVEARRLSRMSPARRKTEVLNGFAIAFGEQARHPIRYLEQNWSTEPWIRGGFAGFFPPGVLTEYRYLFDKPIGRLHFASTETGRAWWGNIEAALQSGERAANQVLRK